MNHNSIPLVSEWLWALTRANRMASKTGRRWRVRQAGRLWYAHEVDQPVVNRKPEPVPTPPVPIQTGSN